MKNIFIILVKNAMIENGMCRNILSYSYYIKKKNHKKGKKLNVINLKLE